MDPEDTRAEMITFFRAVDTDKSKGLDKEGNNVCDCVYWKRMFFVIFANLYIYILLLRQLKTSNDIK